MWDYSEKVLELFYNPINQGAIADTNEADVAVVYGEVGSISCGDALRLHLKIQQSTDTIVDARFQTFGCTSAIASSSALTEIIKGLTLDAALQLTNQDIAAYLGGLPEAKMHCSVMGQEALEAAIYKYRGLEIEHHEDDEGTLICSCFSITVPRVRRVIIENDLTSIEQVTHYVKAGGGCGSCLANIEDLLLEVKRDREAVPGRVADGIAMAQGQHSPPSSSRSANRTLPASGSSTSPSLALTTTAFFALTIVQKIRLIQQVLDQEIRPILTADGGNVELFDLDGDRVLIQLKGACHSCASSTETVKYAIEAKLRDLVSPTLSVEAV